MTGGLGETVVCFWYTFWCRVIESLLDFGVITKETLLSFDDFPRDPERAVGPAQPYGVVAGSVRRWRRGGPVELAT